MTHLEPSAARQLDQHLDAFVDAVMTGDDQAALAAFVNAQSLPALATARDEAHLWTVHERHASERLDLDQLDHLTERQQAAAWTRSRSTR